MRGFGINRRSSRRMLRHHDAWLAVGGRTIECRVANVSRDGVKIVVAPGLELPEIISISLIPGDAPQCARIAWFKGENVGLSFSDANY